jgi:hypothetical protein
LVFIWMIIGIPVEIQPVGVLMARDCGKVGEARCSNQGFFRPLWTDS